MRITGGVKKNTPLRVLPGIRPTGSKARQAVFNILGHTSSFPPLEGARVADVFAGTGALGLESLSRGARHCTFLDKDHSALRHNIQRCGLVSSSTLLKGNALRPQRVDIPFSLVFLDPPYHRSLIAPSLNALCVSRWITQGTLCIIEKHPHDSEELPPSFRLHEMRTYGSEVMLFAFYHGSCAARP